MILLSILITISLDSVWISLGENWCWSPLGVKGLSSLVKSTASNLYFLLYRSSRLCYGSNGFPGFWGMYGFTWSISVRVRLLVTSLFCFPRDVMPLSRRHRIAWYVIPSLVPGPAKFNFGLFSSKVPLLLVPGLLSRSGWRVGRGSGNEVALVPGNVKRPGS